MVISKKSSSANEIKISIDPQDFGNEKDSREKYICMKYLIFMNYYGFLFVYARNNLKSSTVIVYDIHSFYLISSWLAFVKDSIVYTGQSLPYR